MQDLIPQTLDEQAVLAATKDVPQSLLTASILIGTPDEVLEQAAELRDAGLRCAVVVTNETPRAASRSGTRR